MWPARRNLRSATMSCSRVYSAGGTRRRGRPKKTWRSTFQEDLRRVHLTWNEAEDMASDRSYWRQAAAKCALQHGRN